MNLVDFFKNVIEKNFKNELISIISKSIDNAVYSNIDIIKRYRNIFVVSVGKVSLIMFKALVDSLEKHHIDYTKAYVIYDNSLSNSIDSEFFSNLKNDLKVELIGSTHPLVSKDSFIAAKKVIDLIVENDSPDSLFLFLVSGGSSAMIEDSAIPYYTLSEIYKILLNIDLNIYQLNTYRTFLSNIKGGKLLQYFNKSKIISFIISDVPFNSVDIIGSGLTAYYKKLSYEQISQLVSELSEYLKILVDAKMFLTIINKNKEIQKIIETKKEYLNKNLYNIILLDNFDATYLLFDQLNKLKEIYKLSNKVSDFDIEIVCSHINLDVYNLCNMFKSFVFTKLREYLKGGNLKGVKVYLFGGETFLKVLKDGYGGRIQHLALLLLKELYYYFNANLDESFKSIVSKIDLVFLGLATDAKDGNTNNSGVIFNISEFFSKDISKLEKYINNFNSGIFFENPKNVNYVIKLPYGLINLNEIYGFIFDFKE